MYLEWMGKNRAFVEKFIRYANTYAAVYKKEALYGTDIPISFEQVQVLEYLLEKQPSGEEVTKTMYRWYMRGCRIGVVFILISVLVLKILCK